MRVETERMAVKLHAWRARAVAVGAFLVASGGVGRARAHPEFSALGIATADTLVVKRASVHMVGPFSADAVTDLLQRLETDIKTGARVIPFVRTGGTIAAIAPGHFRVVGLSRDLRLGALVGVPQDGRTFIGEVVQIDREGATVKPFDTHFAAPLDAVALRMPPLR